MSNILSSEEVETIMAYDKFAEDMDAWNRAMKAYYYHKWENFKTLPNTENEIIFLGNSITDGNEWSELFKNPNVKNRGIGGDDTDGILERLEEVTESMPAKIFILIGTNDLAYGKDVDYIINNYNRILDSIQKQSPNTELYIQSVLPVDDAIHYTRPTAKILEINDQLKVICKNRSIVYVDIFGLFANDSNKLDEKYSLDGLHLNGNAYVIWKDAIEKYVNE